MIVRGHKGSLVYNKRINLKGDRFPEKKITSEIKVHLIFFSMHIS